MGAVTLRDFRDRLPGLSAAERLLIVDQARMVLDQNYVHLDDKRRRTGIDPVAECERLRTRAARWGTSPEAEMVFHEQMLAVFDAMRDRHTRYLLPAPLAGATAFLPFAVDTYVQDGREAAVVSEVLPDAAVPADFRIGVVVTHWNGVRIDRVLRLGHRGPRMNTRELTVRPLRTHAPPAEDWVIVGYDDGREARFEWRVRTAEAPTSHDLSGTSGAEAADPAAHATEVGAADVGLPWSLRAGAVGARVVRVQSADYGQVTLPSFVTASPREFVRRVGDAMAQLPAAGLIVDARGNTGGNLTAAMGVAQLLSVKPVLPALAQMRATAINQRVCRVFAEAFDDRELLQTVRDLDLALEAEVDFTPLRPLGRRIVDETGAGYPGPVVVIVDGFSYSATDVFAGLVQRNIGPILSTTPGGTGGGGANVWTHDLLCELATMPGGSQLGYERLPRGAGFTVAMRRLYRPEAGGAAPIEDIGVIADVSHVPTRNDALNDDTDMISAAILHLRR